MTIETKKEKESGFMNNIFENNKEAMLTAGQLELGRLGLSAARDIAKTIVPPYLVGYLDNPVANIILANCAKFIVQNFEVANKTFVIKVVDAMLISSYQEALRSFNLDKIAKEFIDKISKNFPVEPTK